MPAALRASLFALLLTIWSAGLAPALASTQPSSQLQITLGAEGGEVPPPPGIASIASIACTARSQPRVQMPVNMMPAPAARPEVLLACSGEPHARLIAMPSRELAFQRQHRGRAPPF